MKVVFLGLLLAAVVSSVPEADWAHSVVMNPFATAENVGHAQLVVEKKYGQYRIIRKHIQILPDKILVSMILVDPIKREVFPLEMSSSPKGLKGLIAIDSVDFIEDDKGKVIGLIGYADGEKVFTVKFKKEPPKPDEVVMFFNSQPPGLQVRGVFNYVI